MNGNSERPVAVVTMADGSEMRFVLRPDKAPATVANFVDLAEKGFYDGLCMHRVIPGFMIQGGGMTTDGERLHGKPAEKRVPGEFRANGCADNDIAHKGGVISMARTADPDSATSQFFICVADCPHLDGQYAAFGEAADEDTVLAAVRISEVPTRTLGWYDDVPVEPVVISSVKIVRGGTDN